VINYFFFVAEELRAIMAELGFRTVARWSAGSTCSTRRRRAHWKAQGVDLSKLLHQVDRPGTTLNWSGPRTTGWKPRSTTS
jgi:glutamate synthase (NADPH/NADH) large chain